MRFSWIAAAMYAFGSTAMLCMAQVPDGVEVHIPMLSETGQAGHVHHGLVLGGTAQNTIVLKLNVDDVRHVMLHSDDLLDADMQLNISGKNSSKAQIALYRLEDDAGKHSPQAIAAVPIPADGGAVHLHGSLLAALNEALAKPNEDHGLLLALEVPADGKPIEAFGLLPTPPATAAEGDAHVASLSIMIRRYPNVALFSQPIKPKANEYVRVVDGHLNYEGQRLRLWGVCRHFWGGNNMLERMQQMGFNAIRLWGPRNAYTPESASRGVMGEAGSLDNPGSLATFDKFFAEAKAHGFFLWMAGLHYDPMGIMHKSTTDGLEGLTSDHSFLIEKYGAGQDWDAWKDAVTKFTHSKVARMPHELSELIYFDPRLKEVYRRQIVNLLNHVNPYTGLKYAEDESIATWELNNEQGLTTTSLLYGINSWPTYFKDELRSQWCQWLKARYGDDSGLQKAWGVVKAGESLEKKNVEIAPLLRQRDEYPATRAADVIHFFCDVTNSFNQEMRDLIHAQASPGTGSAVVPVTFDTQALPSAPWLYTDSLGDAVSFGTYQFTFHSSLSVPPALYIMDNHTVQGKPTLIYETESARPDPFRAEYPFRVATLASWQDWDGVFYHYWSGVGDKSDEAYAAEPMDLPRVHYMDGGIYPETDPATCASLSMAGQIFLKGAIAPSTKPVIHAIDPKQVYSFRDFNGIDMRGDTFTQGAVASFATEGSSTTPSATTPAMNHAAVECGHQIVYDWPNGRMIVDTPTVKMYVGQTHGAYRFSDGIVLEKVSSPFVCFAMLSADGKPLAGSDVLAKKVYVTAKFNSQNAGFAMNTTGVRQGESSGWDSNWSDTLAAAITNPGRAPTLTDHITYQLDFPNEITGQTLGYDFAMREMSRQTLAGNLVLPSDEYMSTIEIDGRGKPVETPASSLPKSDDPQAPGQVQSLERPDPALVGLFVPLHFLSWGQSYGAVYQELSDSTLIWSSKSKRTDDNTKQGSIELTYADLPGGISADVSLRFSDGRLMSIVMTARDANAALDPFVKWVSHSLGQPQQSDGRQANWVQHQGDARLTVKAMRNQGEVASVTYTVSNN